MVILNSLINKWLKVYEFGHIVNFKSYFIHEWWQGHILGGWKCFHVLYFPLVTCFFWKQNLSLPFSYIVIINVYNNSCMLLSFKFNVSKCLTFSVRFIKILSNDDTVLIIPNFYVNNFTDIISAVMFLNC